MTPMVPMPGGGGVARGGEDYSARDVLEVAARHGVVVQLEAGRPIMRAAAAPPTAVVALLRQHRDAVAELLASRAAEQDVLPATSAWPDGADYWLTASAVRIAHVLNEGGEARWCPSGGLDLRRADGRYLGFSRDEVERLRAAGLLHPHL